MIIGKLVFGKDGLNFGLELCLARAGLKAFPVTAATARGCDILLVSMFWYRNLYELAAFLRKAGIRKGTGRPWIVAGGMQATMTPEAVAGLVDWVFVGDADDHLGAVIQEIESSGTCTHPNIYSAGMDSVPIPAQCAPSGFAIKTNESGGTLRCEIARGCKYKCAFCCLAGLKPYTEVPFSEIEPHIKAAKGKRSSFFAPERTCHSEWPKIKSALKRYNVHDMGQDARLEHLQEVDGATVTFGLEGLSERLRRSIGKPFSDDMVIDRMGRFVESRKNVARVSVYFIAGLPGENESDWDAVWSLFEKIGKAEWSRRLVLCPVLNPLSPKPYTRLADAQIDLFADYEARWKKLLRRDGGQWGFRVIETLVWGPLERTMDALVQRGGAASAEIIKAWPQTYKSTLPPAAKRESSAVSLINLCETYGVAQSTLEGIT
jgi:radical SAM superfamily enzyme YgiQ (UPF0313 family)